MPDYLSTDPNAGSGASEKTQYLSTDPSAGADMAAKPEDKRPWYESAMDIARSLPSMAGGPAAMGALEALPKAGYQVLSGKETFKGATADIQKSIEQRAQDYGHDPSTPAGQAVVEGIGKGIQWVGEQGKAAAANMVRAIPGIGEELYQKHWPFIETAGEQAGQAAPFIAGAKAVHMPIEGVRAGRLARAGEEMKIVHEARSAGELAAKLASDREMPLPADLFGTDQPSPIPPGIRSPYNLTPEQIKAGTEDIAQTAELAGRVGQPQGDLFETPEEKLQRLLSEGATGARDKPEVPFVPQDRPGNPPGIYPETQPRGEFQSQEPAQIPPPSTIDYQPSRESPIVRLADTWKPSGIPYIAGEAADKFKTPESGQNIRMMRAQDYLNQTPKFTQDLSKVQQRIDVEHGKMAKGTKLEIPYIERNSEGTIVDHDGRHRVAAIAQRFGTDAQIPVEERRTGFKPDAGPKREAGPPKYKNYMDVVKQASDWFYKSDYYKTVQDFYNKRATSPYITEEDKRAYRQLERTHPAARTDIDLDNSVYSLTDISGVLSDPQAYSNEPGILHNTVRVINILRERQGLKPIPTVGYSWIFEHQQDIEGLRSREGEFAHGLAQSLIKTGSMVETRASDGSRIIRGKLTDALHYLGTRQLGELNLIKPWHNFLTGVARKLATLKNLEKTDLFLELDKSSKNYSFGNSGVYYPDKDLVAMAPGNLDRPALLLHEALHAALVHEQYINPESSFNRGIQALYQFAIKDLKIEAEAKGLVPFGRGEQAVHTAAESYNTPNYGFKNEREFVAELAEGQFRDLLSTMKLSSDQVKYLNDILPHKPESRLGTYYDAFLKFVLNWLGRPTYDETNLLDQTLRFTSHGLDKSGSVSKLWSGDRLKDRFDQIFAGPPGKSLVEASRKTSVPEAMVGAKEQFEMERRPFKDVLGDAVAKGLKDITDLSKLGKMFLGDRTISILMQDQAVGKLFKWTVDKVSNIDRVTSGKANDILYGTKYKPGMFGIKTRVPGSEGMLTEFNRMYNEGGLSRQHLQTGLNLWFENIGKREISPDEFPSSRMYNVYKTTQEGFARTMDDVNQARKAGGLQPIPRIPSYFPAKWEGDYRVFVRDQSGKLLYAEGFKTSGTMLGKKFGAEAARDEIAKRFPNTNVEVKGVQRSLYDLADLSAFDEALRVMSGNDPVTQAIKAARAEIIGKRGFGKHGVQRTGVLGWMGMEKGDVGMKNSARVMEQYVNQAYRYVGNIQKRQMLGEIHEALGSADFPNDIRKQIPNTIDVVEGYIHRARGMSYAHADDNYVRDFFQAVGAGASFPGRAIRGMSSWITAMWLWTPRFLASQPLQPLNAMAKFAQMLETGEIKGTGIPVVSKAVDPMKIWADGYLNLITREKGAIDAANWLGEKGYLDPTIVHAFGNAFSYDRPISTYDYMRRLQSLPAAMAEHYTVRLPVALMYENALRKTMPDNIERWTKAGELTNHYMTDYRQQAQPGIFKQMDIAGDLIRPLKSYSVNFIGQFMEHLNWAKDKKDYAPLSWFLATNVLQGGLKGTLMVAEVNAAIAAYNYVTDSDMPDINKLLMTTSLPDSAIFGVSSAATGYDLSSSTAAPGLSSLFSVPIYDYTKDFIKDVLGYVINHLKGQDTAQDRLRAALALAPKAFGETIKEAFTPPGGLTANPGDKDIRGNYRRNTTEALVASVLGAKPINEAKADMIVRSARQFVTLDTAHRMNDEEAIVDRLLRQQKVEPQLMQRYMAGGGDPRSLQSAFKSRMMEHNLDYMQAQRLHPPHRLEGIQKLQRLEEYMQQFKGATEQSKNPVQLNPQTGETKQGGGFVRQSTVGISKPASAGRFMDQDITPPKQGLNEDTSIVDRTPRSIKYGDTAPVNFEKLNQWQSGDQRMVRPAPGGPADWPSYRGRRRYNVES